MSPRKEVYHLTSEDMQLAQDLSRVSDIDILKNPDIAHVFIHHHKVVQSQTVKGLDVSLDEKKDRVVVKIRVEENAVIKNPVHMCFGMMIKQGTQKLEMDIKTGDNSKIEIVAHCAFPNAENVKHIMDADINIGKNSLYSYFERHIHGDSGGVEVIPKAKINLKENAKFRSEFELLKGRAGVIDIDYETFCGKNSTLEMISRIHARADDKVKIRETGHLNGDYSRGFLNSRVAVRGRAKADVYNKLTASGAYARGHVDCTEIIQDNGEVSAIPIVEVTNPKAHVTHEASLGSVDSKQLQTLMARGLTEDEATDLIIQGMLS